MNDKLSPDQARAKDGIWIFAGSQGEVILTGSAGTGKTFTLKKITEEVEATGVKVHLTATTHKATKVLGDATGRRAQTIHNLLGLKPKLNDHGEQVLVRASESGVKRNSLLVIDEASMVDSDLLRYIREDGQRTASLILYIGDQCQLPPVGKDPRLFDIGIKTFELTTIHRQAAGNPIIRVATKYRGLIRGEHSDIPELVEHINADGEGIELVGQAEFERRMCEAFDNDEDTRVLSYTNARAIEYNRIIRRALYGYEAERMPILAGERLVANAAVIRGDTVILPNETEVIAKEAYRSSIMIGDVEVAGTDVTACLKTGMGIFRNMAFFVPDDLRQAKAAIKILHTAAMKATRLNRQDPTDEHEDARREAWRHYFEAVEQVADLRVPYAGTVHKAQGSTFESVFVDIPNMEKCREDMTRWKLTYTALTRSSQRVVINTGEA